MILGCKIKEGDIALYDKIYSISDDLRRNKADLLIDKNKALVSLTAGLLKRIVKDKYNFKYVSLTHSHNYAFCIGENTPCGIDIEKIREPEDRLLKKTCTPKEIEEILNSQDKAFLFTSLWSKKEAAFKAGVGKSMWELFKENEKTGKELLNYEFEVKRIFDDFVLVTCIKK